MKKDIEELKEIKSMSVTDMGSASFNGKKGLGLFWLLKRIILDQEKRISILEKLI
jgi:hypothetical protein